MSVVKIYKESRKVDFRVDQPKDYELFEKFPEELLEKLQLEDLAVHAHDWVVKTDTYSKSSALTDFFDILATDEHEGEEFILAVEGKHYPVTGLMFHPET